VKKKILILNIIFLCLVANAYSCSKEQMNTYENAKEVILGQEPNGIITSYNVQSTLDDLNSTTHFLKLTL
jgi:hypothetical protein